MLLFFLKILRKKANQFEEQGVKYPELYNEFIKPPYNCTSMSTRCESLLPPSGNIIS